jgi:dynein heavy chain, axonemal
MSAKKRYVNGLEKLAFAESQVAVMRNDLEELQPQLQSAAEETDKMMMTIEIESKQAEEKRKIVAEEEAIANEKASQAQQLKVILTSSVFFLLFLQYNTLFGD